MTSKIIIKLLDIIHYIFALFLIFGGYYLPRKYLKYYLLIFPVIYIHWKTNNDKCFLTTIVNKESIDDINEPFMPRFFRTFGIRFSDEEADRITYMIFTAGWMWALCRVKKCK